MHARFPSKTGAVASMLLTLCLLPATAPARGAEAPKRPQFREPPVAETATVKVTADEEMAAVVLHAQRQTDGDTLCLTYGAQRPGPTIYADPGSQLNIDVRNSLEGFTADELRQFNPPVLQAGETDEVASFLSTASAITNLHTHGLHVSPQGRSDNVLLRIVPEHSNLYTIDLPPDHAPGTHWYHAHLHGSTALQVQGGMSGALIVRPPEGQELDPPGFAVSEQILVVQVDCTAPPTSRLRSSAVTLAMLGTLADDALPENLSSLTELESDDDLAARIDALSEADQRTLAEALGKLDVTPLRFLVNGLQDSALGVTTDTFQRLRIVNSGSRRDDTKDVWVEGHDIYLAAFDGVNLTHLPKDSTGTYIAYNEDNPLELAPGNRADVYFLPTSTGSSALMMRGETRVRLTDNTQLVEPFTQRLLTFEVSAPAKPEEEAKKDEGEQEEGEQKEDDDLERFLEALDANLVRLQETQPYQTYLRRFGSAPSLQRQMEFNIIGGGQTRTFEINGRDYNEQVDGGMHGLLDYLGKESRDGGLGPTGRTPWPPRTGTEEAWTITNPSTQPHPFHIHVSPFWVYDIEENGTSVRASNPNDPRIDRWQDVITLTAGGSATIWQRFSDFEGLYVVHCHFLQHEDRGMMINILLVPNDNEDPAGYFDAERAANCQINNEINGTDCPCPQGCSP